MYIVFKLFILIINIEAVTNIISKSDIFKPIRHYLFNHSNSRVVKFIHELIDCPYCTSVWVSLFYTYLFLACVNSHVFVFFMLVIAFHRLSNILHHIIDRFDRNSGYDVLLDKENDK